MKKRLISCILALLMALSLMPAALALSPEEEMLQVLAALDIMGGYPDGELRLEQSVTRAEFTKMAIAASPMGDSVGQTATIKPYSDVPREHWAAPYVEVAKNTGLIKGFLDGTFRPDQTITLAEGVTMVVRLLGYEDTDFSGVWPSGQMALFRSKDLDLGISASDNTPMTRRDAMYLFYNLLTAKTKDGRVYLAVLDEPMTPSGDIDRLALINNAMEGPVIMAPGWERKLNCDPGTIRTVYRAGRPSSLAQLEPDDVIYFSDTMHTLWAYTTKVSGQLMAIAPNTSAPTSIKVSGKDYPLETQEAILTMSNLGHYEIGDPITLLLGRDGGVAGIAEYNRDDRLIYGVITAISKGDFTDSDGHTYNSKSVTVFASDGSSYTYPVDSTTELREGALVQVSFVGSEVQVERIKQTSLQGTVDKDATKISTNLKSHVFAPHIQILDTDLNGRAMTLLPARLAGVELESTDVRFYRKNLDGEIDILILNNVTGDLNAFGVLTKVDESVMEIPGISSTPIGSYQVDVKGERYDFRREGDTLKLPLCPVMVEGSLRDPKEVTALEEADLNALNREHAVTAEGHVLTVWDNVSVYEVSGSGYHFSSLERVRTGYKLTAYYDAPASEGGCVRVVLARPVR